jgi:hypothetical protein
MSSTEAIQRVVAPALQVELPMASATTSNSDMFVGEECRKADVDTAMGEDARSLEL